MLEIAKTTRTTVLRASSDVEKEDMMGEITLKCIHLTWADKGHETQD